MDGHTPIARSAGLTAECRPNAFLDWLGALPPELLWYLLEFVEDTDLRHLVRIPQIGPLIERPEFAASRTRVARARLSRAFSPLEPRADAGYGSGPMFAGISARPGGLHCARAGLRDLVAKNVVRPSLPRLAEDGRYWLGPEMRRQHECALRLQRFMLTSQLTKLLARRANVTVGDLTSARVLVPSAAGDPRQIARPLHAQVASLHMQRLRSSLRRKLEARPSISDIADRGLLPAHTVVAPCSSYLSLLSRQVPLARHLSRGRLIEPQTGYISRWPASGMDSSDYDSDFVPSDDDSSLPLSLAPHSLDEFLKLRASPLSLAHRKLLRDDRTVALMVCPGVRPKIRFFEELANLQ